MSFASSDAGAGAPKRLEGAAGAGAGAGAGAPKRLEEAAGAAAGTGAPKRFEGEAGAGAPNKESAAAGAGAGAPPNNDMSHYQPRTEKMKMGMAFINYYQCMPRSQAAL